MLTTNELRIEVTQQEDKQLAILSGELTAAGGSILKRTCGELLDCPAPNNITLDLSGLSYINTAGIALLMASLDDLLQTRTVHTVGLSPHHQRLFRVVGLSSLIEGLN